MTYRTLHHYKPLALQGGGRGRYSKSELTTNPKKYITLSHIIRTGCTPILNQNLPCVQEQSGIELAINSFGLVGDTCPRWLLFCCFQYFKSLFSIALFGSCPVAMFVRILSRYEERTPAAVSPLSLFQLLRNPRD